MSVESRGACLCTFDSKQGLFFPRMRGACVCLDVGVGVGGGGDVWLHLLVLLQAGPVLLEMHGVCVGVSVGVGGWVFLHTLVLL